MKTAGLRLIGATLLLATLATGFLWFYWFAPLRHLNSSCWMRAHSLNQQWAEVQQTLTRPGEKLHESGGYLGIYGDKSWAAWLLAEMKTGRDHSSCAEGHLDSALPFMTNQELGTETNAWLAWWTTNNAKSQLEWIEAGFRAQGIELSHPATTNNIIALLKVIGQPWGRTNQIAGSRHPSVSLRYNAFRWLRDCAQLHTDSLNLELLPSSERPVATQGLLRYAVDLGVYGGGPGRLTGEVPDGAHKDAWFRSSHFEWGFSILLAGLAGCGLWLLFGYRSKLQP